MPLAKLQGTDGRENFILGEKGLAFGSIAKAGPEDDAVIIDLRADQDILTLAGTPDDYLLRPTSIPFEVNGYRQYTTALAIFLTDRTARTKKFASGGSVEGNEITTIAWIVQPRSSTISFDAWVKSLGLTPDTAANKPIDDYRKKLQQTWGGEFTSSNYLVNKTGKPFVFDGSPAPMQSTGSARVVSNSPAGTELTIEQDGNTTLTQASDKYLAAITAGKKVNLQWLDGKTGFSMSKLGAPNGWKVIGAEVKGSKLYLAIQAADSAENTSPDYWQKYQIFSFDLEGKNAEIVKNPAGGAYFSSNQFSAYRWITAQDSVISSTYHFHGIPSSINEGATFTSTIKTTGVAANTTLYWELSGTGVKAEDFDAAAGSNPLRGEGNVNANGELSFSHKLKNDWSLNEGDETLQIKLFSDATRSAATQVGQTASVVIKDTSKRTYTLTTSAAALNEGGALRSTLKTTGVAANTTLYWELSGAGVKAEDFDAAARSNPLRGEGKVNANGEMSFSHKLKNDWSLNEGDETLQIKLFSDATRSAATQVGQTASVVIKDTSRRKQSETNQYVLDPITGQKIFSDIIYSGSYGSAPNQYDPYASSSYEVELSANKIIINTKRWNWKDTNPPRPNRFDVARTILTGNYTFNNGAISGKTSRLSFFNVQKDSDRKYFMENAQSYIMDASKPQPNPVQLHPSLIKSASYFYSNLDDKKSFDSDNKHPSTPFYSNRAEITRLPDINFFADNWWENPFDSNLL